jgi:outer membrane lipoprotein-sorting protein
MLSKVGAFGVCAASVCVALVFSLWGGNSVFAQVQSALKKVKTASYTVTMTVGDQPAQTWKVKLLGDTFYRVDQPNGIYLVFDVKGKKIMEVNPGESKVRITENLPVPKDYNILAILTDLKKSAAKAQPGVPNREIGGVMAVGFIIEENGAAYKVWVDSKTNLPLEMRAERKVPVPDGQGDVKEQVVKEHWTDFRFDQQFDESQFTLKAPEGFAVETRQALGRTAAEERDRALRGLERQKAAIEAAKKKAAEKK